MSLLVHGQLNTFYCAPSLFRFAEIYRFAPSNWQLIVKFFEYRLFAFAVMGGWPEMTYSTKTY